MKVFISKPSRRKGLHLQGLTNTKVFPPRTFLARGSSSSRPSRYGDLHLSAISVWRSSSPSLLLQCLVTSARQKTSCSRVAGPLVCSPSPSWLVLVTESSISLGVVDVVVAVEVNVWTEDADKPLKLKWWMKVW
jgi:hypothetical protein